ncbi:MAG: Ig-like domain-containing protein [Bacteroidaceae bacterium]|nr:Ig-like domain-containing protein [Bacteroidaceae bacterium]
MENVSEEINVTVVKPAVIPSEITVMNGEDIITALELDATTNEVTLTAVVGEEGAPQAVVWASDDENVATVSAEGVVTGVAPGTASITVTASGYDDVYATVEVTVTYPESTIPATVEVIDETEMTKTIYTLAQENLIKNGSFEYPNGVGGWKTVGYETDAVASNFTITTEGGVDNGAYLTTNGGAASSEKTIRQSMPVVAGKTYYFAVYTSGKAPSSDNFQYNALFKMTDATTEHGVLKQFEWPQGAGNTSTEWSMTGYVFTADAEHPYVGVRMGWNSNTSFDNFVLVEATVSQVIDLSATAADYAALNAAIADAESKTLGFLQDEYAPYNNVAALQALAAAKAIDQEAKNWPADVQAATGALNTAIWTMNTEEVNAVYNGDFGLSTANTTSGKDVDAPGWVAADGSIRLIIDNATTYPALAETTAGKAAFAWGGTYNYGGKVGYTMPLAAHTVYELTFKHAGWNGANNNFSVSVKNSDNEGLATQSCGKSSAGPQTAGCWSTYVVRFTTGAAGDYTLSMMPNGNSTFTDITLFQVPVSEVTMRIRKANKYGTFVAPFAVTLPEGVTAQKVTNLEANGTTLEMEDVNDVIPAHTPVVIYKGDFEEEDPDFETKFYGQATSTQTEATVGLLTGVYYEQPAPVDSYVLQNIKEKVAFYQVEDGRQPNMRPYSAYLTLPAGYAKPISLSFGDDEATAIAGIEALTSGNMEGIYTTSGAKVNSLQKGVNIIRTKDGKSMKVYVK